MKKLLSILLKTLSAVLLAIVALVVGFFLLMNSMHNVKPSVKQLEEACGVRFPAFSIEDKEVSVGSCYNYDYTVKFKKKPGPEVFDRIEYLCKNGNVIEDDITGIIHNPWSGSNGQYRFSIDDSDNHAGYRLPFNVRWMSLSLSKDLDLMQIHYSLDD